MRRMLAGTFRSEALGNGRWRLTGDGASRPTILLQGAMLQGPLEPSCTAVSLDWGGEQVAVTLQFPDRVQTFRARSASIQELEDTLYERLPLASFDARAQRFWRRIFLLARVPGGVALLRALARRRQSG
jgi:hypothetical protein